MPFNPDKITREDVLKAVEVIEKNGYDLRTSTGYDVIINGKPYPPKEIMRYAHEIATGEFMWNPGGGEPTNKYLKKLGFEIMDKSEGTESSRSPVFTWIPAYEIISQKLLQYENKQQELIDILQSIGITNFNDQDLKGNTIPLTEIDPLTFLCYLNKYGDEKRLLFLRALCEKWDIDPLPEDVKGIPNVNAQRVWLFQYKKDRTNNEIQRLWNFYKAMFSNKIDDKMFYDVLEIRGVGKPKLTEGMFLAKPGDFLCLNAAVKPYLESHNLSTDFGSYEEYVRKIQLAKQKLNKTFPEISCEAYLKAIGREELSDDSSLVQEKEVKYSFSKKLNMSHSLNTILYGPPGTGKTYHTINKSVAIANPQFDIAASSREQLKKEYERLVKDGQIEFITFHQSMSYEDFIEGIKPDLDEGNTDVTYSIQDGIFKKIVKKAGQKVDIEDNFLQVYKELLQEIEENDGSLVLKTIKKEKEFTIYENSKGNLRFHANTEKAYEGVIRKDFIATYLQTGEILDWVPYTKGVGEYIKKKFSYTKQQKIVDNKYVLIIDEINRGNVSQIFGELITLIEDDKRRGSSEELTAVLPYSKKPFSVPPNLYIIGTMNTADRSVEALDTALRRRFSFEEMAPNPQLINSFFLLQRLWAKHWNIEPEENFSEWKKAENEFIKLAGMEKKEKEYSSLDENYDYDEINEFLNTNPEELFKGIVTFNNGIRLDSLLISINKRLETLLSKDHTIGHALIMNVFNLEDLKTAFKNKILPLLQEFFYNDYAKIGLVLGDKFVQQSKAGKSLFAKFKDDNELAAEYDDKLIYTLTNCDDLTLEDFKSVYE